jgi:hypothetical protein
MGGVHSVKSFLLAKAKNPPCLGVLALCEMSFKFVHLYLCVNLSLIQSAVGCKIGEAVVA